MAMHASAERKKNPLAATAAKPAAGVFPPEHRFETATEGRPWNFAAVPVLAPPISLQPKLRIGAVSDPLEREADAGAERVPRMPDPSTTKTHVGNLPVVQRKCAACEREDEDAKEVARKESSAAPASGRLPAPPIVHEVLNSPGEPLDFRIRAYFEPRFGADFSNVRVHTGALASESAGRIQALAYTAGRHIVFGEGRFRPQSESGSRLLAHELTHVVQQNGGAVPNVVQRSITLTDPAGTPPHPAGMLGPFPSKAFTMNGWLTTLCPEGGWTVNAGTGVVDSPDRATFCGAKPTKGKPHHTTSAHPAACGCFCELTATGSRAIEIQIDENLTIGGSTFPLNAMGEGGTGYRGAAGNVTGLTGRSLTGITGAGATTPLAGAGRTETIPDPPAIIFGHEVCGHARLQTAPTAVEHTTTPGGTASAVDVENRIRREQSTAGNNLGIRRGEIRVRDSAGTATTRFGAMFTAGAGDSISAIAVRCGISAATLLDHIWRANGDPITAATQNTLAAGENLLVEDIEWHQVIAGETFSSVATLWGIPLTSLQRANPQVAAPYTIHPGDRLLIPAS